jgi:predicted ATPase
VRVTRLRFKAFKSLYDVVCDLDQLTVLTGPNNAGKSNLVDAINFLSEMFEHGLEIAVARAGGYENVVYRRNGSRGADPIEIGLEIHIGGEEAARLSLPYMGRPNEQRATQGEEFRVNFVVSLTGVGRQKQMSGDFAVLDEQLSFRDRAGTVLNMKRDQSGEVTFRRAARMQGRRQKYSDMLYPLSDASFIEFLKSRPAKPTALSLAELRFGGILTELFLQLGRSRVFQLSPHQCRQPGVSTPNAYLDRYGSNLPSVADYMRKNSENSWMRVQTAMRSVVPQLESIDVSYTDERRLALHFREVGLDRPWNSSEVSDGTIQVLALFVALFDGRSAFLAVEEPENALHPWVLRQFIDLCGEQRNKQILLTTHSPIVVDYVSPRALRLVWQRKGRSSIAKVSELSPQVLEMWKAGELRTFEAYDSGLLDEFLPEHFRPAGPHDDMREPQD